MSGGGGAPGLGSPWAPRWAPDKGHTLVNCRREGPCRAGIHPRPTRGTGPPTGPQVQRRHAPGGQVQHTHAAGDGVPHTHTGTHAVRTRVGREAQRGRMELSRHLGETPLH